MSVIAPLQGAVCLAILILGFRFALPQAIIFVAFSDKKFRVFCHRTPNSDTEIACASKQKCYRVSLNLEKIAVGHGRTFAGQTLVFTGTGRVNVSGE